MPARDRDRLGALLCALEPRLYAVALRVTRDRASAEDVVQNAFEKALRHRNQFRGESRVSTWLHRIVVNEALMWLRSERRRFADRLESRSPEEIEVPDRAPSAAERLVQRQREERVRAGVAALEPAEQAVLLRCGLEGWSYSEFGSATGIHPAAVKSRAFRARRRLSLLLGDA